MFNSKINGTECGKVNAIHEHGNRVDRRRPYCVGTLISRKHVLTGTRIPGLVVLNIIEV